MNFKDYTPLAMRTNVNGRTDKENLINACLGLIGEYVEFDRTITKKDAIDELSDVYWYAAQLHTVVGSSDKLFLERLQVLDCIGLIADIVKKHVFQGHELDNSIVCLADQLIYALGELCLEYDCTPSYVMSYNINKLKKRYPEGFEEAKSINREEYKDVE